MNADSLANAPTHLESFMHEIVPNLPIAAIEAFLLSAVLWILVEICKYHVAYASCKRQWWEIVMECPIDICSILATVYISFAHSVPNINFAIIIVVAIVAVFLCSYFRRKAIINLDDQKKIATHDLCLS